MDMSNIIARRASVVFFILTALYHFTLRGPNNNKVKKSSLKFAHRGASLEIPENTLASIKKAFELNADGVEIDIQMTADKRVIVLHDDTLKRTATYTPELKEIMNIEEFENIVNTPVSKLQYDKIKKVNIGLWKGKNWLKETIPTLDEVLHFILSSGKNKKKIQLEIKGDNLNIIPELKKILAKYPQRALSNSVTLIGFDLKIMKEAKKEIPYCSALLVKELGVSSSCQDINKSINNMISTGLDGIDFEANHKLLTKKIIEEVHSKKKIIGIWTCSEKDTQKNMDHFEKLGVDFQTTNLYTNWVKK